MSKYFLFFILFIHLAFAGGEVGNGGHVVKCLESQSNDWVYKTLDEVASPYSLRSDFTELYWRERLEIILEQLKNYQTRNPEHQQKISELAKDFEDYFQSFLNFGERVGKYQWKYSDGRNRFVQDHKFLDEQLPDNCNFYQNDMFSQYIQVSHRMALGPDRVDFLLDGALATGITRNYGLSWVLVHEWLWGHLDNAHNIRKVNAIIHSEFFKSSSGPYALLIYLND